MKIHCIIRSEIDGETHLSFCSKDRDKCLLYVQEHISDEDYLEFNFEGFVKDEDTFETWTIEVIDTKKDLK